MLGVDTGIASYLGSLAFLAVVTAVLGYVSWKLTRWRRAQGLRGQAVRVLDRVALDAKRSLLVVNVGSRHWLVGATEHQLNLISELTTEDLATVPAEGFDAAVAGAETDGKPFPRLKDPKAGPVSAFPELAALDRALAGVVRRAQTALDDAPAWGRLRAAAAEGLRRVRGKGKVLGLLAIALLGATLLATPAHAAAGQVLAGATAPPKLDLLNSFDLRAPLAAPGLSTPIQLIFIMSALTLMPFLVIMTTSFMRTIIVLSFLRQAMGTQSIPPNPVMVGLSLFLALYTMSPVINAIDQKALQPYLEHRITQSQAFTQAVEPLQEFMLRQTSEPELAFFIRLSHTPPPASPADVPLRVAIPAFMVSELSTAFKIGFVIFIPFLVIDLTVSSILLSLSMSSLPPTVISTAFKILIFTLANGWHLVIQALVQSFR